MSDLANRLVQAATNAADKAEVEVYAGRRLARADLRHISEAVIAAVLRELETACVSEIWFDGPQLRALAGVVEEGEKTDV